MNRQKTLKVTHETVYGITGRPPEQAVARQILMTNGGHWCIENSCYYVIDWNDGEDRNRRHTGHGPENLTRHRRFAVGLIQSKGVTRVARRM